MLRRGREPVGTTPKIRRVESPRIVSPGRSVGHLPSAAQPFITAMLRRRISASAADWEST